MKIVEEIECGSIWKRAVDGTTVEVQATEGPNNIYVKVLSGPGLVNDVLNTAVLKLFWDKKS